jgi:AcrR family transcriptional regulator
MGLKERKERQKSEMREAILAAALKLFAEQDFGNVTMRKIADTIEYSVGTLYLYFKDKNEILFELHKQGFAKFYNKQLSVQHIKDPVERLTAHGFAYIEFAMENPEYYDVMFISRGPGVLIKQYEKWDEGKRTYDLLKLNISQAQEVGSFKDSNVEVVAFFLWSFVHGVASLYVRQRLTLMPVEFIKPLIKGAMEFLTRCY